MLFDTHNHLAPFSYDAIQTIEELLGQADRLNLAGVCTADHYEKDLFYDHGREDIFNIDEYFRQLLPIKNSRQAGQAKLLIGVEFGWLPHLTAHLSDLAQAYPFDEIILSLHILDGEDPFIDKNAYLPGKMEVYSRYLNRMAEIVRVFPDFDILGHFDYISRYCDYPDRKMRYDEMPGAFDNLLSALVSRGKSLEINTRTITKLLQVGYDRADAWPDQAIIQRYLTLGGQLVSLGSDGHMPLGTGELVAETADWLKSAGCRHLVHYENRLPICEIIR